MHWRPDKPYSPVLTDPRTRVVVVQRKGGSCQDAAWGAMVGSVSVCPGVTAAQPTVPTRPLSELQISHATQLLPRAWYANARSAASQAGNVPPARRSFGGFPPVRYLIRLERRLPVGPQWLFWPLLVTGSHPCPRAVRAVLADQPCH